MDCFMDVLFILAQGPCGSSLYSHFTRWAAEARTRFTVFRVHFYFGFEPVIIPRI